jgi:hypothetical protein
MTPLPPEWVRNLVVILIIVIPTAMVITLAGLLSRLRSRRLLQRGLIHIVFLPEKRRRFLVLLVLLGSFFVAAGAVEGLNSVGLLDPTALTILSSTTFLGGGLWLFLLIWTSLHPGNLTPSEVETLRKAPDLVYGLAFAPFEQTSLLTGIEGTGR